MPCPYKGLGDQQIEPAPAFESRLASELGAHAGGYPARNSTQLIGTWRQRIKAEPVAPAGIWAAYLVSLSRSCREGRQDEG